MTWKRQFITALVLIIASDSFADAPVTVEVVEVRKIWDQGPHNAFTDLVRWNDAFYCAFREGRGHVSTDGKIRVLESRGADTWASAALFSLEGYDLRDAHLSITPDGRLMLVGGAAPRKKDNESAPTGSFVSYSKDGKQWTEPRIAVEPGRWLWCVTWHEGKAYGVTYTAGPGDRYLDLLVSADGIHYEPHVARLFEQGRPTEVTLRFDADGTCYALIRRDRYETEPTSAFLGVSRPDYKQWQWKDLGADFNSFGGPNFIQIPGGYWLAAGRMHDGGVHTALCYLDVQSGTMTRLLKLPSGGDTSYPGLVWHNETLYVSYYSSHEAKTSIYLAKLRIHAKPVAEAAPSTPAKSFLSAEQILTAWESTYGSIKTMRVSYRVVLVESRPPTHDPNKPLPSKRWHVERVEHGQRYHIRFSKAEDGFKRPESVSEHAFDGRTTQSYWGQDGHGSVFTGLAGRGVETENYLKERMFLDTEPARGELKDAYPNGISALVKKFRTRMSSGRALVRPNQGRVGGELCHVVELLGAGIRDGAEGERPFKELFWMAHDKGMCVMKYQFEWDGRVLGEMEVTDIAMAKMDDTAVWYPRKAYKTQFGDDSEMYKWQMVATEFVPNIDVDENTFRFDFPKGTYVVDRVRGISGVDLPREPPSLMGKPLPAIKAFNVKPNIDQTKGKMILVCFFDMNQRPSRNCITQLAKQAKQLKEEGVIVVAIQASKIEQKQLNKWFKKDNVPFPVGMIQEDEEKIRFTWGVKSLPWLILTDKGHIVTAEGFSLGELDDKLRQAGDGK